MPIKGLTNRGLAFPQIGDIRKGAAKDPAKNAPGRDLHHFRVEFDAAEVEVAAKFTAIYGAAPTDINIVLPFDDIAQVWDPWCEAYTAGRMVARSDGEYFQWWVDLATGEIKVKDGLDANGERVPHQDIVGKAGKTDIKCRPVGRLRVIIPDLQRAAYLVVHTTSIIDIRNISEQLEAIRWLNGGHIAGVPLVLRRRPKMISCPDPSTPGKKVRREKWMISIEADPRWVSSKLAAMDRAALPAGDPRPALPDVPEDVPEDEEDWSGAPDAEALPDEVEGQPSLLPEDMVDGEAEDMGDAEPESDPEPEPEKAWDGPKARIGDYLFPSVWGMYILPKKKELGPVDIAMIGDALHAINLKPETPAVKVFEALKAHFGK